MISFEYVCFVIIPHMTYESIDTFFSFLNIFNLSPNSIEISFHCYYLTCSYLCLYHYCNISVVIRLQNKKVHFCELL